MSPIFEILLAVALGGVIAYGSIRGYVGMQLRTGKMANNYQLLGMKEQTNLAKENANLQRAIAERENITFEHEEKMRGAE